MSQFTRHYAQLHDEDLIHLALTRELVPEATEALYIELKRRGIEDLSSHRSVLQREATSENAYRHEKTSVISLGNIFFFAVSALFFVFGTYRIVVPNTDKPEAHGFEEIKVGISLFFVTLIWSLMQHLWRKYVIYRKPPA